MKANIRKTLLIHLIILFTKPFLLGLAQNPQTGMCSYYASNFQGRRTASGEKYNNKAYTAAHNTLPFQTWVIVTNLNNNKSVKVRINDRGPHTKARVIDISHAAAQKIGLVQSGVTKVKIEICLPDSLSLHEHNSVPIDSGKNEIEPTTNTSTNTNAISELNYKIGKFYLHRGKEVKPHGYFIQVGSYSNFDTYLINEEEWAKNQKKEVYCEVSKSNSKKLYRLLIGPYTSKSDAQTSLNALNRNGTKGLIKKY